MGGVQTLDMGTRHLWRTTFDIRPCWDCGQKVLSNGVEVLPETVAAAVAISLRAGLVEPAGAMGLLESVLIDARERGLQIVSPDEVYHVADFGEG